MVFFITGASHTGKTLLAQRLLERYHYPYFSIDLLKMGLIRSGYTSLTPQDDQQLEDYLWPVVREMAKTALENGQNLVVEGGYIPFRWREDFEARYLEHLRYCCLVMSRAYIERRLPDIKRYANAVERRLDDSWCTLETLLEENSYYLEGCRQYGCPYVLIDRSYPDDLASRLMER